MLYRTMKKNGDVLSILGFGAMRLPLREDRQIDEERATRQIRDAIDQGVNYVDTAWPYHSGESELFLGRALADGYRQKVRLATKLPSWLIKSRDAMDRYLDAQLEKLQTDHIDYYLVHSLNAELWDSLLALQVLDFLQKAKQDGRIVNAGFSFHGAVREIFQGSSMPTTGNSARSSTTTWTRTTRRGQRAWSTQRRKGLGVIVMEPLRGGDLGKPSQPPAVAAIWDTARTEKIPRGMGVALGLEPPGSHGRAFGNERRVPHFPKHRHCRRCAPEFPFGQGPATDRKKRPGRTARS